MADFGKTKDEPLELENVVYIPSLFDLCIHVIEDKEGPRAGSARAATRFALADALDRRAPEHALSDWFQMRRGGGKARGH